tara:strand:- start:1143 stop:1388 length:246 start_codon:yes stop_codon:yes gene_type:complete
MPYRLHIDIPLSEDEDSATEISELLMQYCFKDDRLQVEKMKRHGVEQVNYRLGHDEDRQKSNYLDKNGNGHVSNKKSRISL